MIRRELEGELCEKIGYWSPAWASLWEWLLGVKSYTEPLPLYEIDHYTALEPCSTRHMTPTCFLVCFERDPYLNVGCEPIKITQGHSPPLPSPAPHLKLSQSEVEQNTGKEGSRVLVGKAVGCWSGGSRVLVG